MIEIFSKDSLRKSIENLSDGAMTVLYDKYGIPSIMYVIPRMKIGEAARTINQSTMEVLDPCFAYVGPVAYDVHPAFRIKSLQIGSSTETEEKLASEIFIGAFQSVEIKVPGDKKVLASLPGRPAILSYPEHKIYSENKNNFDTTFVESNNWRCPQSYFSGWHLMNCLESGLLLMLHYKALSGGYTVSNGLGYNSVLTRNPINGENSLATVTTKNSYNRTLYLLVHLEDNMEEISNAWNRGDQIANRNRFGRGVLSTKPVETTDSTIVCLSTPNGTEEVTYYRDSSSKHYILKIESWAGTIPAVGDVLAINSYSEETGNVTILVKMVSVISCSEENYNKVSDCLVTFKPLLERYGNNYLALLRGIYNCLGLNGSVLYEYTPSSVSENRLCNLYGNSVSYIPRGLFDTPFIEFYATNSLAKELVDGVFLADITASTPTTALHRLYLLGTNYASFGISTQNPSWGRYPNASFLGSLLTNFYSGLQSTLLLSNFINFSNLYLAYSSTNATLYFTSTQSTTAHYRGSVYPIGSHFSDIFEIFSYKDQLLLLYLTGLTGLLPTHGSNVWDPANGYGDLLIWPTLGLNNFYYTDLTYRYNVSFTQWTGENLRKMSNIVSSVGGSRHYFYYNGNYNNLTVMARGSGRLFAYIGDTSTDKKRGVLVPFRPSSTDQTEIDNAYRNYIKAYSNPEYFISSPWHISFEQPNVGFTSRLVYVNCQ